MLTWVTSCKVAFNNAYIKGFFSTLSFLVSTAMLAFWHDLADLELLSMLSVKSWQVPSCRLGVGSNAMQASSSGPGWPSNRL